MPIIVIVNVLANIVAFLLLLLLLLLLATPSCDPRPELLRLYALDSTNHGRIRKQFKAIIHPNYSA